MRGEGVRGSEKIRRAGHTAGLNRYIPQLTMLESPYRPAIEGISDLDFVRLRLLPKPIFRMPRFWRDFQRRDNTTGPSRSIEVGGSAV